jgi:hypothetical protein
MSKLAALGWLCGSWQGDYTGGGRVEEHWTAPAAGTMMGTSRIVRETRLLAAEFLLLEEKPDGITLSVILPGRQNMVFDLAELRDNEAVFVLRDGTDRLSYKREPDGSIYARMEKGRVGRPVTSEFRLRPMR